MEIRDYAQARFNNVEIAYRPSELGGDDAKIFDVVKDFAAQHEDIESMLLFQPTSPFVDPSDVVEVCKGLELGYASAQTVTKCPHNSHGYNQREIDDNGVRFVQEDRSSNKQGKPERWLFGNLLGFNIREALRQEELFAVPSYPVEISSDAALDIDNEEDLARVRKTLG